MKSGLEELIGISRYYGENPDYVIAGGGNTSFKDDRHIWIKASGIPLSGIGEDGFVCLSREKLAQIETGTYSDDPVTREAEVKRDILEAIVGQQHLRPSVETSLHNLIGYAFVVHTHPTLVNGLMCSKHVKEEVEGRFGEEVLFVEYTDPGYILFKRLQERINTYSGRYGISPRVIFLQNHGVFVSADSVEEIRQIYANIELRIQSGMEYTLPSCLPVSYRSTLSDALNGYYASRGLFTRAVRCDLVEYFTNSLDRYLKVSRPFSPDIIVYCKSNYLFFGNGTASELVIPACEQFEDSYGYYPKVILEEQAGLIAVEDNPSSLGTVIDVFTDLMKISFLSERFGGPHFMTPDQIRFIDNWEVEHYRRKVAKNHAG